MNRSPRILIIPSWYPPDGGYFFKEHSEAIHGMGWDVDVLVTRMVGARKLLKNGFSALRSRSGQDENGLRVSRTVFLKIPGSERLNIQRRVAHIVRAYNKYEKQFGKPDLILAHSASWAGYAASLINEEHSIPYMVVEHRSYFVWQSTEARKLVKPFYIPLFEKTYRNCRQLVLVSESQLSGLKTLYPWIEEKVMVIPNMIREDMFMPPTKVRETNPFVFFWAGRLEKVKGVDILLKAADILRKKSSSNFTIRLAGRGSLSEELKQMAVEYGLADCVYFLGRLSREEMQDEMRNSNCFVLPTRYEAFGVVLIEAMASGLPLIATRSGGPDTIVKKENGLLVDPDNPRQLAEAMDWMLTNHVKFTPENIRAHVLKRFGQSNIMQQYNNLLIRLLEK